MENPKETVRFSDNDVRFLIETVEPRLLPKVDILKGDESFINGILEHESGRLFKRIMLTNEEIVATVTPRLLFEVLLRNAVSELKNQTYTIERTSLERIPVFDAREVSRFLEDRSILTYLAELLASFTKVQSYTIRSRIRKGIWGRTRFSDMDIDSLIRLCQLADEDRRFDFYKRIADLCLFISGIFPENVGIGGLQFSSRETSPRYPHRLKRTADDYEHDGRLFYKLAGQHRNARILSLDGTLLKLNEEFTLAKKPLNYISDNYLELKKGKLFPIKQG